MNKNKISNELNINNKYIYNNSNFIQNILGVKKRTNLKFLKTNKKNYFLQKKPIFHVFRKKQGFLSHKFIENTPKNGLLDRYKEKTVFLFLSHKLTELSDKKRYKKTYKFKI